MKGHVTRMDEVCHTYAWGVSHVWMKHAMSHIWMRHAAHGNTSHQRYETIIDQFLIFFSVLSNKQQKMLFAIGHQFFITFWSSFWFFLINNIISQSYETTTLCNVYSFMNNLADTRIDIDIETAYFLINRCTAFIYLSISTACHSTQIININCHVLHVHQHRLIREWLVDECAMCSMRVMLPWKRPIFSRKSRIFSQKSSIFCRKSPIDSQKSPLFAFIVDECAIALQRVMLHIRQHQFTYAWLIQWLIHMWALIYQWVMTHSMTYSCIYQWVMTHSGVNWCWCM